MPDVGDELHHEGWNACRRARPAPDGALVHHPGRSARRTGADRPAGRVVPATAMLATSAAVALVVYEVVGLRILRSAWVNLDRLWACAVLSAGAFVWLH